MPTAGATYVAVLTLTTFGPDTVAALALTSPTGVAAAPVAAPVDSTRQTWTASLTLPVAGVWYEQWTVTGTGATVFPATALPVAPASPVSDPRHTYATSTHYADITHAAPPADVDLKLRDATALVDEALICAVYPVDDDGMPTDAAHILALRHAVVAAVRWWEDNGGDPSGAAGRVQSASIGGVSLGFGGGGGRGSSAAIALARMGPAVRPILAQAGLLNHAPYH